MTGRPKNIRRRMFLQGAGAGIALGALGGATAGAHLGNAPGRGKADLLLHNGRVLTMAGGFEVAEAIAVKDGVVQAVGRDPEMRRFTNARTEVVNLRGRTVIPGVNDAHFHPMGLGTNQPPLTLDLSRDAVSSIAEIRCLVAEAAGDGHELGGHPRPPRGAARCARDRDGPGLVERQPGQGPCRRGAHTGADRLAVRAVCGRRHRSPGSSRRLPGGAARHPARPGHDLLRTGLPRGFACHRRQGDRGGARRLSGRGRRIRRQRSAPLHHPRRPDDPRSPGAHGRVRIPGELQPPDQALPVPPTGRRDRTGAHGLLPQRARPGHLRGQRFRRPRHRSPGLPRRTGRDADAHEPGDGRGVRRRSDHRPRRGPGDLHDRRRVAGPRRGLEGHARRGHGGRPRGRPAWAQARMRRRSLSDELPIEGRGEEYRPAGFAAEPSPAVSGVRSRTVPRRARTRPRSRPAPYGHGR